MQKCILRIEDQVNCKFIDLDPFVRRKIVDKLKFFVPYARHMPAFKLGRWDGKVGFATVGGGTYINLLDRVLSIVIDEGYDIEIDDQRPQFNFAFPEVTEELFSDTLWPEGHPAAGEPIILRDYQVDAIKRYLDNLQSIQSISTGAGKTLLTAALSKLCEPYGRTLIVVPSKSLVEQTEEDYLNLGLDTGVYFGDRKELGHTHTIITWQSLGYTSKNSKMTCDPTVLKALTDGVICVQIDECHSAKADVLKNLMGDALAHVPIRWGLTGTVPKEDFEFLTLLSTIGPVVGEIRAKKLQDEGVLAACSVEIIQTVDDDVEFRTYPDEYQYLTSHKPRLDWIADYCIQVNETGNTLILVDRIETGEYLQENIPDSVFINGRVKSKDRKREYKEVQTAEGKIIIATYGVASVGINIPRIFNLVLVEAGKSFVRVIQSIGRGLRKAGDKDAVNIYDLCSTLKFSGRHLAKRKVFYKEAEYAHKVSKVNY
jgi:superfamily II DNA or RNA helicase